MIDAAATFFNLTFIFLMIAVMWTILPPIVSGVLKPSDMTLGVWAGGAMVLWFTMILFLVFHIALKVADGIT